MTSLLSKIKLLMVALAMLLIPSLTTPAYAGAELDGNTIFYIKNGILYAMTGTTIATETGTLFHLVTTTLGPVSTLLPAFNATSCMAPGAVAVAEGVPAGACIPLVPLGFWAAAGIAVTGGVTGLVTTPCYAGDPNYTVTNPYNPSSTCSSAVGFGMSN